MFHVPMTYKKKLVLFTCILNISIDNSLKFLKMIVHSLISINNEEIINFSQFSSVKNDHIYPIRWFKLSFFRVCTQTKIGKIKKKKVIF